MTVIAAVRDSETSRTYIASDTMAKCDDTKMPNGPKWVRHGNWAVGQAGQKITSNIVQAHADEIFDNPPGAWTVAMRIRDKLVEYGFQGDGQSGPQEYGQNLVIAHPGGVWSVYAFFGVLEIPDGVMWADGSGRAYALGAYHASRTDASYIEQVEMAVMAAIEYCDGCGDRVWSDVLERGPMLGSDSMKFTSGTIIDPSSRQATALRNG